MKLRIATYNVSNLFERANVFQLDGFSLNSAEVLGDVDTLNKLLEQPSYAAVKKQIKELLEKYELHKPIKHRWFTVNEIRKKLYSVNQDGRGVTIQAAGRKSWLG